MQISATTRDNQGALPAILSQQVTGENHGWSRTDLQVWFMADSRNKLVFSFETFIGLELSLVPQVETIFVRSDSETGKGYTVITVINERDPHVRALVYAREQAIMDEARGIEFSFRVVSRMNRDLSSLIDNVGKVVFQRKR
ncbi:MAG: hypothetical protein ABSF45_00570 [Terriglobia bacterium]|jgi:hypothetical protein